MTKRLPKSPQPLDALPADYAPLLAEIKTRVQSARIKAGLAANRELLAWHCEIGQPTSNRNLCNSLVRNCRGIVMIPALQASELYGGALTWAFAP